MIIFIFSSDLKQIKMGTFLGPWVLQALCLLGLMVMWVLLFVADLLHPCGLGAPSQLRFPQVAAFPVPCEDISGPSGTEGGAIALFPGVLWKPGPN